MGEWYNQSNKLLYLNINLMNSTTHQLRANRPTIHSQKSFELMPASMLPYRKTWQPLMHALPRNAYLIVTKLDQKPVNTSLLRVVNLLRRQGQTVYVLSVGD